jgi:hypothetical protein
MNFQFTKFSTTPIHKFTFIGSGIPFYSNIGALLNQGGGETGRVVGGEEAGGGEGGGLEGKGHINLERKEEGGAGGEGEREGEGEGERGGEGGESPPPNFQKKELVVILARVCLGSTFMVSTFHA